MNLLIDIGNSRIKWGTAEEGRVDGPHVLEAMEAGSLQAADIPAWSRLRPARVLYCSVVADGIGMDILRLAAAQWQLAPERIRSGQSGAPIRSAYDDATTLGDDRWANLAGVHAIAAGRDHVVVDAGTAVTVDALRGDGHHPGGAIMPGLMTVRAGLHAAAPVLPIARGNARLPATNTPDAVAAGTMYALAGGIERVVAELSAGLEQPRVIVTGGDASTLMPLLPEHWHCDPVLTLRGLAAAGGEPCA